LFGSEPSDVSSSAVGMALQMAEDVYEQVHDQLGHYRVIGQLWDMYIVVAGEQELYYIDQHALAERIAFEKLRKETKNNQLVSEPLLQPIVFDVMQRPDLEEKLTAL
jgi:DNA mismatch repair protein MutL